MSDRNTFVVTLEDDVVEFLDVKNKSASEINTYINQLLMREKQQRGSDSQGKHSAQKQAQEKGKTAQA